MSRESAVRSLLVAAAVAFFCSLLVSAAVIYLRPIQLAWAELGRSRLILELVGLTSGDLQLTDREVAARFREVDVKLVELATGRFNESRDPLTFEPLDVLLLAEAGVDIPAALDTARLGRRAALAPVYLLVDDGAIQAVVLPLWGQGMWAPMHAFLALDGRCSTVRGIALAEHGETPGVGDRIELPAWRASWTGLEARDEAGQVMLAPRGSGLLPATQEPMHAFDAISGATVTVNAVTQMVRYWLGAHGFGPFLDRCRAGEVPLP